MTDSGNGSKVLQRLLAEKYRADSLTSLSSSTSNGRDEIARVQNKEQSNNIRESQLDISQYGPSPAKSVNRSDVPALDRLDALCRSTLEKRDVTSDGNREEQIASIDKLGSLPFSPRSYASNMGESNPSIGFQTKRSNAQETLTRLRLKLQEDSNLKTDQMKKSTTDGVDKNNFQYHLRFQATEPTPATHTSGSRGFGADGKRSFALRPELQLHGHPKSNSGDDVYLYTDQLRKNNQRRGIRSKKHKNGVGRSSSLRHTPEDISLDFSSCPPGSGVDAVKQNRLPQTGSPCQPDQARHCSSRSAPLQTSGLDASAVKQRRLSLHAPVQTLKEKRAEEREVCWIEPSMFALPPPKPQTETIQSEMHHQVLPHQSATYVRGAAPYSSQAPYYSGNNNNVIAKQTASNEISVTGLGSNSPPRPPPPPYPRNYGDVEANHAQAPETDVLSWHPQRPKSLALGNCSKKKSSINPTSQSSPCITSPNSAKCLSPAVRGTPLYSNVKEAAYMSPNVPAYNNSPHQRQTSNGSSTYARGTGSNVMTIPSTTPSSSGSSTVTAATTPAYQDLQNYSDPGLRSPVGGARFFGMTPQGYAHDTFGSSSGINKSESINSASSGGSAACRNSNRNRNSNSKFNSYGSASGSSSNSGSRPNSNSDLAERLETENEVLRNHLEALKQKVRKYEAIERELVKVTQRHQELQQNAENRERLEKLMISQLTAKLETTEKEKAALENQVISLTQQLKSLAMTSDTDETGETSRENSEVDLCQARSRKLAEHERQLQEELDECRERMSEQKKDIELLQTSLHKAQSTVAVLQEQFMQNSHVDAYTEKLTEQLHSLQKIVDARHAVEQELHDQIQKQLKAQRPLKSTSSNDEGISEMETPDLASSNSVEFYSSREGPMLGAKAEMLKWQHRYLEHGLMNLVHSSGTETSNQQRRLGKAMRSHRHAVSDPGFDNNPNMKSLLPELMKSNPTPGMSPRVKRSSSSEKLKTEFRSERPRIAEAFAAATAKADCACQTPSSAWFLGDADESTDKAIGGDAQDSPRQNAGSDSVVVENSSSVAKNLEGDSPSEGYHSQQSSGSPTPNLERFALSFTPTADRGLLTNSPKSSGVNGTFKRNRSADDVLVSLKM